MLASAQRASHARPWGPSTLRLVASRTRDDTQMTSLCPESVSRKCEETMSTAGSTPVYEELLELLAESADVNRLLAFGLSPDKQMRLDELLERSRQGTLSDEEAAELDEFERVEHLVRLLKARLLRKQRR